MGVGKNCLVVIRIRGRVNVPKPIKDTLKMLHLTRVNHATLVLNDPSILGMLRRAKDYITWGEISQDSIALLLKRKGEITRKKKLTEETVKEIGFNSIKELANALYRGDVKLNKLRMKPVFRLHPPIGGYKRSILRPYRAGGELGYRGETINSILKRMM